MTEPQVNIIVSTQKEEIKKNKLRLAIKKKRTILEAIVIKTEMLKVNLEIAKQEYMVKVGNLLLKDTHLDLEIIRLKNIFHHMQTGLSYEEAVNKITNTFYAQQLEWEMEQKRIETEEEAYQKREEHFAKNVGDIKKLWKKLIAKFHPDLVQDMYEKEKRDTIMKQINRAYQEGDYDQLLAIQQENIREQEQTIDNLEEILTKIVNEITDKHKEFTLLKQSEWHDWMIKIDRAKKKNINIFAATERQLLNDIISKLDLINNFKAQIEKLRSMTKQSSKQQ